ncbi:MAG: hypothetical protein WAV74_07805 [Anaerolineae bacterium]
MLRWCSSLFHLSSPHLPVSRLAARPLLVVHLLVVCSLLFSTAAAASCGGFLEPWIYDGHIIQHFHANGN